MICNPKRSDIVKYFYLSEPSFVAIYHSNKIDHVELGFEPITDRVIKLIQNSKDPNFFKNKGVVKESKLAGQNPESQDQNRVRSPPNEESRTVSYKDSPGSISENGKFSEKHIFDKFLNEVFSIIQNEGFCTGMIFLWKMKISSD